VKPVVTRQEYLAAQKQLVLPPGASWPEFNMPESNSVTGRGAGGGQAVLVAMNAWECYWVAAIEKGDAAAGREAHAQLDKLLANNVMEAPEGASENWVPTPLPTHPFVAFAHDGGWTGSAATTCRPRRGIPEASRRAAGRTGSDRDLATRRRAARAALLVCRTGGSARSGMNP
jgi:hypothetical protein